MRKDWLTTITAGVCAVSVAATSAIASPAGMAIPGRSPARPTAPVSVWPKAVMSAEAEAARPSAQISPLRHPVKYLAAAVSELPKSWKSRGSSSNVVADAAPSQKDSIAPETPTGSPTPELVISLAQISERQGDLLQARRHFQQGLSMWPGHVDMLRAAARMEDRQGELQLAETLYQQAVMANPQHAGALNDLGLCLARQGRLEHSVQVIEQAIQLQPDKPLYRNNAATVLVEMRQDQRALAHLATVHGPAEANYNLGQLLTQRGRGADATPYFQAALEQNPELQAAQIALRQLQGQNMRPATGTTSPPAVYSQPTPPAGSPVMIPQQGPQVGPQLGYPATARSGNFGTPSHLPPNYYNPSNGFQPANDPRFGLRPQILPPGANQPPAVRR